MQKEYYLGLDVGGTKVEGAVAQLNVRDRAIKIYSQKRIAYLSINRNIDGFINLLADLIAELLSEASLSSSDLKAIGIGLPGSLDPKTKIMMNGNTQFLVGHDVINLLKSRLTFSVPIFAQNDANLFALAEAWGGVGKKFSTEKNIPFVDQIAIGVTLGTGVGGGLVALGKIFNGAHGSALEVGHIVLDTQGPQCYCGQKGCAEMYLSGTALNRITDSKSLFKKASGGDTVSMEILTDYRNNFLHFLSILNNLFNPHYFVFGGGLSSQALLFSGLKSDLKKNIFLPEEFCPEIYINQLGGSSGLFGAMIYARENLDA